MSIRKWLLLFMIYSMICLGLGFYATLTLQDLLG